MSSNLSSHTKKDHRTNKENRLYFLWNGGSDAKSFHWMAWHKIALLKDMGGWGLKNPHCFAKALAAKSVWRILKSNSLWDKVVVQKYILPYSIEEWFRLP